MNIDPNNIASQYYANHVVNNRAKANPPAKPEPAQTTDPTTGNGINALDKLRATPEIRPDVVAKGKELLNDPDFPSKEMVNEIAKLIVPFADDE